MKNDTTITKTTKSTKQLIELQFALDLTSYDILQVSIIDTYEM